MDLLEKLNKTPPFLCRMLARTGKGRSCIALTLEEIADKACLDISTVSKLSKRRHWNNEPLCVINAFSNACGVNLLHTSRHLDFLKRRKRSHIKKKASYFRKLFRGITT